MHISTRAISLLFVLFMVQRSLSSPVKVNKTKVLILGAGLSGITAAKTLLDKNIDDFLILDGKDYVGGRIHAVPFAGVNINTGANWIHFADDEDSEPLVKLKDAKNLKGIISNYSDFIIRDDKGDDVTDPKVAKEYHDKVEVRFEEFQEERKNKKLPDIPARVGVQLLGWKNKRRPVEKVVEYFNLDFEYSKRPELMSFYQMFPRTEDFFTSDQRGFWSMFEDLYKPFTNQILLNKTVTEIKYSTTGVEVSTHDGERFTADYALCTFSTGVLASDKVTFNPPLPEWKKEVIFKDPMSVYTKIFLKFPSKFWDDHEYILHASEERGHFPVFQDLDRPGLLPGSNVLLVTTTEDEGRRVERQSYNETKAEIMKMLRKIYGQGIPDATDIFYDRWSQDPFVQGSYSEPYIGFTSEEFNKLGQNLERLYFAGEATIEAWYGYMQGAYLTGEEKGKMIACQIQPDERECKVPEKKKPKNNTALMTSSAPGVLLFLLVCFLMLM